MPPYEITLYFKPLTKMPLIEAIKKTCVTILDEGGVIIDLKSLGARPLPIIQRTKLTNKPVYTSTAILMNTSLSKPSLYKTARLLKQNNDLVRIGIINADKGAEQPEECDLEELLKPPAYRETVNELRKKQKMSHVAALHVYKRTKRAWQNIPKSYFVSPSHK